MKFPIVMVNFKAYESSVGNNALKLAKICDQAAEKTKKNVAICVEAGDIYRISSEVKIPVLAEHVDPDNFGAHTGKIVVKDIKDNGAIGSLLNHSEDRYRLDVLEEAIKKLKEFNLISVVCANDDLIVKALADLKPDVIAIEPPELIGGDVSVTDADPEIIKRAVQSVKKNNASIPVLCGAGIKTGEDVKKAIELGCDGVLVASGVTKAEDPEKALLDLLSGLKGV